MHGLVRAFIPFLVVDMVGGCASERTAPKRFAWVTGVKAEKVAYYKQLHAHPWPSVTRKLKESNIQNYSIHMKKIDGRIFLFSYLEYTGTDWEGDMKKMAADPETQRWWKETDPCQQPLSDAAAKGQIWSDMEEVFYLR